MDHIFNKYWIERVALQFQRELKFSLGICCCCSVSKLCLILCNPMNCRMPGFPVLQYLCEFAYRVSDTIQPSQSLLPLLLWPSTFPTIRVFSNESALCIRWPKYWSFSFSTSPSNEYSRWIFFRIDWFDRLAVQGTLKSLLQSGLLSSPNLIFWVMIYELMQFQLNSFFLWIKP